MDTQNFVTTRREDGAITIHSGPRLTIENAAGFADCISGALAAGPKVTVEFAAALEADLTALQILCSACKTATAAGKIFTPQGVRPEGLSKLIAAAGAEQTGSCTQNHDNLCIWFGGI